MLIQLDNDYTISFSKTFISFKYTPLIKQQVSDLDPEAIQQINFVGNLAQDKTTTMCLILNFLEGTMTVL